MKISNTSHRLKELMSERKLKQVDVLELTNPLCVEYNVKMNKSDISQYVSGKVEPNQKKLFILSKALGVNEAWLMGYDAPKDRATIIDRAELISANSIGFEITEKTLKYSPGILAALYESVAQVITTSENVANGTDQLLNFLHDPSVSLERKALIFRSMIDVVVYDKETDKLSILYATETSDSEKQKFSLDMVFSKLNSLGKSKVIDYATDLSNMTAYTDKK